jgi:hypothetical protein
MSISGEHAVALPGTSPSQARNLVCCFLNEVLPAHISGPPPDAKDGQPCELSLSATVMLDFVPISMDVSINVNEAGTTMATFAHPSQSDIVRFNCVIDRLTSFLRSSGVEVVSGRQASIDAAVKFVDDDFSDDEEDMYAEGDLKEDSSTECRHKLLQADLSSSSASLREEAFRLLAREVTSSTSTAAFASVADVLVKSHLESSFLAGNMVSLAEMFPFAAVLQQISNGASQEACEILSGSPLYTVLDNLALSEYPAIITNKLQTVVQSLRLWKAYSQKLGNTKPSSGACIMTDSTRCTETDYTGDIDDDVEEDWDACRDNWHSMKLADTEMFAKTSNCHVQVHGPLEIHDLASSIFGLQAAAVTA